MSFSEQLTFIFELHSTSFVRRFSDICTYIHDCELGLCEHNDIWIV